jgi:hypothetical protein
MKNGALRRRFLTYTSEPAEKVIKRLLCIYITTECRSRSVPLPILRYSQNSPDMPISRARQCFRFLPQ